VSRREDLDDVVCLADHRERRRATVHLTHRPRIGGGLVRLLVVLAAIEAFGFACAFAFRCAS